MLGLLACTMEWFMQIYCRLLTILLTHHREALQVADFPAPIMASEEGARPEETYLAR